MANVEQKILSKIVAERSLTEIGEANVRPDFFQDPKAKQVFTDILKHRAQFGEVPTLSAVRADHPDYKFIKVEDGWPYLIEEIRKSHKMAVFSQGIGIVAEAYDQGDPESVSQVMYETLRRVAHDIPVGRDTNLTETGDERYERYMALKDLDGGLRGIPTGFDSIDRVTQGLQNGQLITFVGPPKAGKSTLMLLASMAAHNYGVKPLFIGFEMTNHEQEERYDAIRAKISHSRLRNGSLKKEEEERLRKSLNQMSAMPDFWLSTDTMSATTLSGVQAKIETLEPDVIFIDGVYMMEDELGEPKMSPQALTNITRGMKRMAQNLDLPIAISTQALESRIDKKHGLTSRSIGYTSSFAQDSDAVFGVEPTEEPDVQKLKLLLARQAAAMEVFVRWDWKTGTFEEIEDPFEEATF